MAKNQYPVNIAVLELPPLSEECRNQIQQHIQACPFTKCATYCVKGESADPNFDQYSCYHPVGPLRPVLPHMEVWRDMKSQLGQPSFTLTITFIRKVFGVMQATFQIIVFFNDKGHFTMSSFEF